MDLPTQVLSICSGSGMFDIGLRLAIPTVRTVCYIEREAFPISLLEARIKDKILDDAPIWSDVKTFNGRTWNKKVDCIIGGYPCQPFSLSGRRNGTNDPRHLWPHIFRIILQVRPRWCFFENVEGHLTLGYDEVKGCLEAIGYKVTEGIFSAEEVGAPHRRKRLFILAYSFQFGWGRWADDDPKGNNRALQTKRSDVGMGNSFQSRLEGWTDDGCECGSKLPTWPPSRENFDQWRSILEYDKTIEPSICRVVDGMDTRLDTSIYSNRKERLRVVGNGVVPIVAAFAFHSLYSKLTGEE